MYAVLDQQMSSNWQIHFIFSIQSKVGDCHFQGQQFSRIQKGPIQVQSNESIIQI